MIKTIFSSILSMAGLGLFFASILAVVNQKLKVKEDPKLEAIEDMLPHVNCGACGYASCHQYAEAITKGEVTPDKCKAGGEELACKLSEFLGVEVEKRVKETAFVHCGADQSKRKKKANYAGIKTCAAANGTSGGEIICSYGCLGYGDCLRACPFDAITMVDGLPRVDKDKCTACGNCVEACPRDIIALHKINSSNLLYVACSNKDKGAEARKACSVACIACGLCQKLTEGIFAVEDNLARVNQERMKDIQNPDEVMKKCPTKCIKSF